MTIQWRETLRILATQFEGRAAQAGGLHHLFVEAANDERERLTGPPWFNPTTGNVHIVDGEPQYGKWDPSAGHSLPSAAPGFRKPLPDESFAADDSRVIRDRSGAVRAVSVEGKQRMGFFCGQSAEEVSKFESLANATATALAGSKDLHEHVFASDLVEIFRKPRGGIRYIFGDVTEAPQRFIASGWDAGVLQFTHGVLVDLPISESMPDARHWLLLLHRLGWRQIDGSGLRAVRNAWDGNVEVQWDMLSQDWSHYPHDFSAQFTRVSKRSFYSVLGTKDSPLDAYLASAFAIQLLLAELSSGIATSRAAPAVADYSSEPWKIRRLPSIRKVTRKECAKACQPKVVILVATETERQAALKSMRPPKGRRKVLQVFVDKNTCFVGRLGVTDIVLCMTAMGSVGRDASLPVTAEMIQAWEPDAVIMAGIAFGKDARKQQIGNVLVAERIISYEQQRVGDAAIEYRGSQLSAGSVLLNRFRNVLEWHFLTPDGRPCGFQVGPMLSGEKLVDNAEFKRELFERYPTAIGGEMEGAGVAAAADRHRCEWIVVKAICDWGDGTKTSDHQEFAAASSVSLLEHVLNQPGALHGLTKNVQAAEAAIHHDG